MDRIEPISPSPPAIAPVDASRVKVRPVKREEGSGERDRREEAERRERQHGTTEDGRPDEGPGENPHIDLRV